MSFVTRGHTRPRARGVVSGRDAPRLLLVIGTRAPAWDDLTHAMPELRVKRQPNPQPTMETQLMTMIKIECTRDFGNGDVRRLPSQEIDFDGLSKAQLIWLAERGIEESARNSFASETLKKHEGGVEKAWHASVQKWNSWFLRLRSGEVLASGGGGARLSLFDQCLRDTIKDFLSLPQVRAKMPEPLGAQALLKLAADVDQASRYVHALSPKLSVDEWRDKFVTQAKSLEQSRAALAVEEF